MSAPPLVVVLVTATAVSLAASWVLVSRIERVGARLGATEALLGLIAALAADTPEITAAVTALGHHQQSLGAGVVIGSNVFNLAALLGLGAVVAGGIVLHRRVVVLAGSVAIWVAIVALLTILHLIPAAAGLALVLVGLVPYAVVSGIGARRLRPTRSSGAVRSFLARAVADEEIELLGAIDPRRGSTRDAVVASLALGLVVAASIALERVASSLGLRLGVPDIVTGGLVLAAITSLPNAVAAVYLARRGRGAATLSTAFNSNALNVAIGFLLPAVVLGIGHRSANQVLVGVWYLALTGVVVLFAYVESGVDRPVGWLVLASYAGFVAVVLTAGLEASLGRVAVFGPAIFVVAVSAVLLVRPRHGPRPPGTTRPFLAIDAGRPMTPSRDGAPNGAQAHTGPATLVQGWSTCQLWTLGVILSGTAAAVDALLGHRVILIGVLIVGPCTALLTARWRRTAEISAWTLALAVLLGIPDGIWATPAHLALIGAVGVVGLVATAGALVVERNAFA